jgi:outer membrane protein assembly factor BamB
VRTLRTRRKEIRSLAFSPDSRRIVSGNYEGTLDLWDVDTGQVVRSLEGTEDSLVDAVAVAPDGATIASGSLSNTLKLWDVATGKERWARKAHTKYLSDVAFSPDGRTLATAAQDRTVKLWNAADGREKRTLTGHAAEVFSVAFSPDGATVSSGGLGLRAWDVATGQERPAPTNIKWIYCLAYSPDGRTLAMGSDRKTIDCFDTGTGQLTRQLSGHGGSVRALAFAPGGAMLVSGSDDTTIRLWDPATGQERASLITFLDGSNLTITPEGYYDASSEKAEENLNVRLGDQVFGIGAYREKFFRPDLVKLALSGGSLAEMARLDKVQPAPRVVFLDLPAATAQAQLQVRIRVSDAGGGIGDVRLFLNGAAVAQQSARGLQVAPESGNAERTFTVQLVNGLNRLRAVAFNAQNTMQSNPAQAELRATLAQARPSLFAVVAGIAEFRNPRLQLRFPVADAQLFAATLRQSAAPLFQRVDIQLLTTPAETTREALLRTLRDLRAKIGPEDLFVFYVASHGTAEDGEYYLITSNVASLSTSRLRTDALSQADLRDHMANLPATKKLIVIDTCDAGALGDALQAAFLTRGMSDATAMKILGRAVGSTVLSASMSAQEALEGYEGHGLFTHVLADGLKGAADLDKDGFVGTLELALYLDEQVPLLAERLFKHAQNPVVSPSGNGFPLGKVSPVR